MIYILILLAGITEINALANENGILQAIFDSGEIESFADTTADGKLAPILILTNNLLPEQKPPHYGATSIVLSDSKDVQMNDYTTLEIIAYKRTKRKADITLTCNHKVIRLKLRDKPAGWDLKSFKLKGKGKLILDKEF